MLKKEDDVNKKLGEITKEIQEIILVVSNIEKRVDILSDKFRGINQVQGKKLVLNVEDGYIKTKRSN